MTYTDNVVLSFSESKSLLHQIQSYATIPVLVFKVPQGPLLLWLHESNMTTPWEFTHSIVAAVLGTHLLGIQQYLFCNLLQAYPTSHISSSIVTVLYIVLMLYTYLIIPSPVVNFTLYTTQPCTVQPYTVVRVVHVPSEQHHHSDVSIFLHFLKPI